MNEQTALEMFRKWVDAHSRKADAAADLGVSNPYLTDLYRGTRPLTSKLLDHIGLVREVTIKRKAG